VSVKPVAIQISRIETISAGEINPDKVGFVELVDSLHNYKLNIGDILFSHINSLSMVGNVAQYHSTTPLYHGMNLLRLQPSAKVESRFLLWWLKSSFARRSVEASAKPAINQASIAIDQLKNIPCLYPKQEEQRTIAAFLDYETARIDKLIAKQQRLIELLKEKRQAVISHAVTKGLNPDAPMKNSGVEWLGEVPEHWEILKGSWLGRLFGSEAVEDADVVLDGDVAFVKVSTLSLDELSPQDPEWFVSPQTASRVRAKRDFIAFPKRGAAIFTNKVNIVPYCSVIDPNLMGWEVKKTINTTYLAYCLKIRRLDDIADVSTVPQINNKHISPQRFPVPPRIEQDEIVERIEEGILLFDKLLLKAGDAILLMQERRTALISSAVTGKIDLRDWVAPTEEVSNG